MIAFPSLMSSPFSEAFPPIQLGARRRYASYARLTNEKACVLYTSNLTRETNDKQFNTNQNSIQAPTPSNCESLIPTSYPSKKIAVVSTTFYFSA